MGELIETEREKLSMFLLQNCKTTFFRIGGGFSIVGDLLGKWKVSIFGVFTRRSEEGVSIKSLHRERIGAQNFRF